MEFSVFSAHLRKAADIARDFAATMVRESLPERIAFDLYLNQSYDKHRDEEHERVFPDDSLRDLASLRNLSHAEVECELWRESCVPAWVDLSVCDVRDDTTIISALCCGRFTKNEEFLYHNYKDGTPPFSTKSPTLPPRWESVEESGRFSLYWKQDNSAS